MTEPDTHPPRRGRLAVRCAAGMLLALSLWAPRTSTAQITTLDTFDPAELGELCSLTFDQQADELFVYGCFSDLIHRYSPDGTLLGTLRRPGEAANDVDVQVAPEDLSIRGTFIPEGTLLFINGESGPAEIYAVDPASGAVLDTLSTAFGSGSVVGGAWNPTRGTFFLVDYAGDIIGEIDPATGETLNAVDVSEHVDVFYGDLEVSVTTGYLFVVSNADQGIFQFTPDGAFVRNLVLPAGVDGLTGIGLDCGRDEAWVSQRFDIIHRLGQVPCSTLPPPDDSCVLIDFETIPGETAVEGLAVEDQFISFSDVSFSLEGGGAPVLAQVGSPAVGFESSFGDDTPSSVQDIGAFFLTDDGLVSVGTPPSIIATFGAPLESARGVALDLDAEDFTIQALDASGQLLEEVVLRTGDPGTGDGAATAWSLDRPTADVFTLRFITTRPSGRVGIGMDNLLTCAPDREPGGSLLSVTEPPDVQATAGGAVPIEATLPAGFDATVREACYRRTGEAEYTCTSLQESGGTWQGAIPAPFVTARGVEYYYRFSDGTSETTVPQTNPQTAPFVLPVQVDGLRAGGVFSPDTYRMVSIPVELLEGSVRSVLDEYGPADPNRWRLLRWDPTLEAYREHPELAGGFAPCEAFWLITFDGADFEVDGRSVDPLEPCVATARPGWNQFGAPYAFPVAWSDVDLTGTLDGPVLYDASSGDADPYVYDVQVLEPWQGYWIFNPGAQDVILSFSPIETTVAAGKSGSERRLAGDEFELRLTARMPAADLVDARNYLGLSARASREFDELDMAEAPPIGDHVRLSVVENDMRLAGSFRPAESDGQAWDLRISGQVEGKPATGIVRVGIDEFGRRPAGFNLRVADLDAGLPVRVDEDGFEVELTHNRPVRNLRLIIGTKAFTERAGEKIPEVPRQARLEPNYPNPFNSSTRIRYQVHVDGPVELAVFDPLGRRIRTLVRGDREPGWYGTVWDGRDEAGIEVPSGTYFYVLRTRDGGSVQRTMVLLR